MRKSELSCTSITLDIFRCSVLILVGENEETIIDGLPDLFKENEWGGVEQTIKHIKENHIDNDDLGPYQGRTIPDGVDAVVIFLADNISEVSEEIALHELGHAMRHICRVHGVDDEETEMYMHEYLFHQFLCAQNDYNNNKTKKTKK